MEIEIIVKIIIISVAVVVASVIFITYTPALSTQAVSTISSYSMKVNTQSLPCNFYCYALRNKEENLLLSNAYNLTNVLQMPTYFSCNYQLLELATYAYEFAKFEPKLVYRVIRLDSDDDVRLIKEGNSVKWNDASFNGNNENRVGYSIDFSRIENLKYLDALGWTVASFNEPDAREAMNREEFEASFNAGIVLKSNEHALVNRGEVVYQAIDIDTFVPTAALEKMTITVSNPYILENATKVLFDCFSNHDNCNNDRNYTMKNYCLTDNYLSEVHYINCLEQATLKDKIPDFNIIQRNASDLSNNFVCTGSFDVCNAEPDKYGDTCLPAWGTLLNGAGRCEDIALFYYTALRTLGIDEDSEKKGDLSVSLDIGLCDLPCPCKKLVEECGLKSEAQLCEVKSKVRVNPSDLFGEINVCSNGKGGIFEIGSMNGDKWTVRNVASYNANYYIEKTFDGDNSNDIKYGTIREGGVTLNLMCDPTDCKSPCDSYPQTLSKTELVNRCMNFLESSENFDETIPEIQGCMI